MKSSEITLSFASVMGRKIEADFDGGRTTSDGGALLLRQAEAKIGVIDRLVRSLVDRRHKSYIDHSYTELISQRVFQIACGYEDANDSNDLRSDPGLKAACDRLPLSGPDLASQPTMSRLENRSAARTSTESHGPYWRRSSSPMTSPPTRSSWTSMTRMIQPWFTTAVVVPRLL